jgi:hypothetical protein
MNINVDFEKKVFGDFTKPSQSLGKQGPYYYRWPCLSEFCVFFFFFLLHGERFKLLTFVPNVSLGVVVIDCCKPPFLLFTLFQL